MTQLFDASALLTAIFEEPDADRIEAPWTEGDYLLCAVNYAEVVAKLAERGMGREARVVTADPAWGKVNGVEVEVIR